MYIFFFLLFFFMKTGRVCIMLFGAYINLVFIQARLQVHTYRHYLLYNSVSAYIILPHHPFVFYVYIYCEVDIIGKTYTQPIQILIYCILTPKTKILYRIDTHIVSNSLKGKMFVHENHITVNYGNSCFKKIFFWFLCVFALYIRI